jgi:hypothetical protein
MKGFMSGARRVRHQSIDIELLGRCMRLGLVKPSLDIFQHLRAL